MFAGRTFAREGSLRVGLPAHPRGRRCRRQIQQRVEFAGERPLRRQILHSVGFERLRDKLLTLGNLTATVLLRTRRRLQIGQGVRFASRRCRGLRRQIGDIPHVAEFPATVLYGGKSATIADLPVAAPYKLAAPSSPRRGERYRRPPGRARSPRRGTPPRGSRSAWAPPRKPSLRSGAT